VPQAGWARAPLPHRHQPGGQPPARPEKWTWRGRVKAGSTSQERTQASRSNVFNGGHRMTRGDCAIPTRRKRKGSPPAVRVRPWPSRPRRTLERGGQRPAGCRKRASPISRAIAARSRDAAGSGAHAQARFHLPAPPRRCRHRFREKAGQNSGMPLPAHLRLRCQSH